MANHKSSVKRARQTIKKNAQNTSKKSRVKNLVKQTRIAIAEGKKDEALKLLPMAQKYLARLAKIGVIKKNCASRKTSRLAKQVSSL